MARKSNSIKEKVKKEEKYVEIINGQKYYYGFIELPRGIDGKRKRKKIRDKSRKVLLKKIEEEKAKIKNGYNSSLDTNFNDFFKKWLFQVKFLKVKDSTKETYNRIYELHIKTAPFATIKMSSLSIFQVQQFYNSCNLSYSLLSQIHKLISPCFKYAYKIGVIAKDYSSVLELPENTDIKEDVSVLSISDQKKLTSFLDRTELYHNLISVALTTGMRIGEVSALEWSDFNEYTGELKINKTFKYVKDLETGKYRISVTSPKTKNSTRTLKLAPKTVEILKVHRTQQNLLKLKLGSKYKYPNLIFANTQGNYLAPHTIRTAFSDVLEKAKIEKVKFHSLRHTFATRLLEHKVPVKVVSSILGHRDTQITENLYQHVLDSLKEEVSNIIEDII